jgi:hypothetical protein
VIDLKAIDSAFNIAAFLFGAAAFATSWLTRGSKANAVKISNLEAENASLHNRVSELEAVQKNQPTREDFHALNLQLSQVSGDIATLSAEVTAVSRIATRIDDFLLNKGSK